MDDCSSVVSYYCFAFLLLFERLMTLLVRVCDASKLKTPPLSLLFWGSSCSETTCFVFVFVVVLVCGTIVI